MKNMKAIISIIIPIYNGEKYLDRCLQTILNQTIRNIEIILVDDGSNDGSEKKCDEYAIQDARIHVIHQNNSGLSAARNVGIEIASGNYIGFVDCDDWVTLNMFEELYEIAKRYDADIVSSRYITVHSFESKSRVKKMDESVICFSGIDKLKIYLELGISNRSQLYPVWTKIYKRELFNGIKFPIGQLYEDVVTNYKLLMKADKFVLYNKCTYFYYMDSISITRNKCSIRDLDLIEVGYQIKKLSERTEIEILGEIMYARTYFSLVLKCLFYGMDVTFPDPQKTYQNLYKKFIEYYPLLIHSNMPVNRKIVMYMLFHFHTFVKKILMLNQLN